MAWGEWNAGNSYQATSYTTNAAWDAWNDDTSGTACGGTNYSCNADPWPYWQTTSVSVTASPTNDVWPYWAVEAAKVAQEEIATIYKQVVFECDENGLLKKTNYRRKKRYEAIRRRREEKQRRKQIAKVAMEAQRKREADKKAAQLLEDVLGLEQYEVYERTGRILIHGKKHDWIVHKSGMVQRFEKHKVIDLCVSLAERWKYPSGDNIVAMALTAKLNEDELIGKANKIRTLDKKEIPECAVLELAM